MDQKVIQYLLDTYKLPLYVFEESVLRERDAGCASLSRRIRFSENF